MNGDCNDGEDADDDEGGEGGGIRHSTKHGQADCGERFHEVAVAEGKKVERESKKHRDQTVDKTNGFEVKSESDIESAINV